MDFEKFIKCEDIDKNYHSVAKKETVISQGRIDQGSEPYPGLYNLDDLDFMYRTTDVESVVSNQIFNTFRRKTQKTDKRRKKFSLLFSGPLIKSIVDPYYAVDRKNNTGPHIRNDIVVYVISEQSTLECLSIKKSNQVSEQNSKTYDPRLYYEVAIDDFSFFVRKKSYSTVSEAVTSSTDHMDRIALVDSKIWVSGLFILEFYNRIQTYDPTRVDPVFGYPSDILNIYDRASCVTSRKTTGLFKTMIDRADVAGFTMVLEEYNILRDEGEVHSEVNVEQAMIIDAQQKYSVIEYLILCMMRTNHMVVLQAHRNMFMMLLSGNYVFIRSPTIFARVIHFGNRFPSLFMMLGNVKQIKQGYPPILQDIQPSAIVEFGISSMYHIDMYLIKSFIRVDDESLFVDYITRIKLVKKLSNLDSKTGRMIVEWLVLYSPQKIISTLFDTKTLLRSDVFRIIFLTESFNLLEDNIVDYIRYRAQKEDRSKVSEVHVVRSKNTANNDNDNDNDENEADAEITSESESESEIDRGIMNDIEDGEILDRDEMDNHNTDRERHETDSRTDVLEDELDEEIDAAIKMGDEGEPELEERLDQIEQNENGSNLSTDLDNECSDGNSTNNDSCPMESPKFQDDESVSSASIDPDDMLCIIGTLEEVVKSGLSHSFFLIHQICPQILDDNFLESMHHPNPVKNIIHWAKSDDSLEVLQLMLKFRPEIVNSRDEDSLTPLLSLVNSYDSRSYSIEKIMVHLLTNEADYEDTDQNGNTILHLLARKKDPQIVTTVLRLVPSIINHQNSNMMTPVMMAAEFGDESMVYTLEGGNADMTYTDRNGNTVYHYICKSGICPSSIIPNEPNQFGFRPSDYSLYSEDFYFFR
jgi:hypothetical protein